MTVRRYIGGQVRAAQLEDGHHVLTLRAITPNVVDDYGSVWMADAFDKALAQRLPVLAWSHDWSDPIGVGVDYTADPGGPIVRARLDDFDAVPRARQAYAQTSAQPPTIRDCSVGFSHVTRREPTDAEKQQWPGVREVITQATMDELSLVLAGAVPGAQVTGVRGSAGIRMANDDAAVSREAAATLIAKTATGELTLTEALNALNALDPVEGDGGESDAAEEPAEDGAADPDAESESEGAGEEGTGSTQEPDPDLTDLEADIAEALELIGS